MQQISAKKFKTRHDCVGKVIHWKRNVFKAKSALKILGDYEKQTDLLIPDGRTDPVIITKKKKKKKKKKKRKRTYQIADFVVQVDHRMEIKENEKRNKYLDLSRELKEKL